MFGLFKKIKSSFPTNVEADALSKWLHDNGFSENDARRAKFYKDQYLLHPGSTIAWVGWGMSEGVPSTFYVELKSSELVIGRLMHPRTAQAQQSIAADAMQSGTLLEHAMGNHSAEMSAT